MIFIKKRSIAALVSRWVFYPQGSTFILHWETRGRVRSWINSHFTTSSIIERFPKKCSLRSTVQASPILFYQVIGRLPRYIMLKYFWNWKSLLPFDFSNILISPRTLYSSFRPWNESRFARNTIKWDIFSYDFAVCLRSRTHLTGCSLKHGSLTLSMEW